MSESNPNSPNENNGDGQGAQPSGPPSLAVKAQYLKDLSFENPNAPASFAETAQPQFQVDVNVNAAGVAENNYEVELSVSARAKRGDKIAFVVEATYAGLFEIMNIPPQQLEMVMLVECPRLLFPFMRQIISDATRNGNYPPLMLEPIDFFAIYQQNRMREAQEAAEPATA